MFTGGRDEEMQPVVRGEAKTQRELLESAGIDASSPLTVLRRLLCRGSRGRNILIVLMSILVVSLVITSRSDDRRAYLYAPTKVYAEDAHLESVHWVHFHRGAPVLVVAKSVSNFIETAMLSQVAVTADGRKPQDVSGPEGLTYFGTGTSSGARLRQLQECVAARSSGKNGTAGVQPTNVTESTETLKYDENGFPVDQAPNNTAVGDDDLRVRVLPVVTIPGIAPNVAMYRQLPWHRLIFVFTNETALDSADVACLTSLQASAILFVKGEWFATHGGLAPPHAVHHVSIALPLSKRVASDLAKRAEQHATSFNGSVMTRLSILLAPAAADGDLGDAPGTFAWWAGRRAQHTSPDEGLIVIAPPSQVPRSPSLHTAIDDAVLGRLYHEHISGSRNASVITATRTVRLGTDLAVVAPLSRGLGPLTMPSSKPLLLTVRPDGFGVFRCPDVALAARIAASVEGQRKKA